MEDNIRHLTSQLNDVVYVSSRKQYSLFDFAVNAKTFKTLSLILIKGLPI